MKNVSIDTLDSFTRAYLVCALWSSNDESTPEGGEPFDANYSLFDFAPEALASAAGDCERFKSYNTANGRLAAYRFDDERAGHDFWLSRNGHGAGFFDRADHNAPEKQRKACAELQRDAGGWGECSPYLGDDGKIYLS